MDYISVKDKIRIVFVFQVASFWTSWESLYKSCIEDERFEVKLMWINDVTGDVAQMSSAQQFLECNSIAYEIFDYESLMDFKPHYMIYQTPYDKGHRKSYAWAARYRRQGVRIVYIPYGIEISDTKESRYKHFSMGVVLNAFNVYVISEEMKEEYEKFCINAKAVRAMGLPRFDNLIDKDRYILDEKYINRVGGRKVVLWKTHFPKVFIEKGIKKQATPRLEEYLEFSRYIKQRKDIFFVFMPHPKFVDHTIDESLRPMAVELIRELETMENVFIDYGDDYRYSLMNADAIIIDRSAVMVEAGAVGVPVLYMYNEDYCEPMPLPIKKLMDSYYHGTSAREMIEFVECCQSGMDTKREMRERCFSVCVPFFDGECGKRIKDNLWIEAHKNISNDMPSKFAKDDKIFLFGTGDMGALCMDAWIEQKNNGADVADIVAFIDNNKEKQGKEFMGKTIVAPEFILEKEYDYIVIASYLYFGEIYEQLTDKMNVDKEKILTFDQFVILTSFQND